MRRRVSRVAVVAKTNHEHTTCAGIDDDRLRRIASAVAGVAGCKVGGEVGDSALRVNLDASRRHP